MAGRGAPLALYHMLDAIRDFIDIVGSADASELAARYCAASLAADASLSSLSASGRGIAMTL